MKYKPYSIASPPYEVTSGGIRVMYGLRSWLETKGQISFINMKYDVPFIGIYPEIYRGNHLEADTVVRYILQKPGVMSTYGIPGPTTFDPSDKLYVFSKIYDTFGVSDNHLLFLPIINLHVFKNLRKNRTKTCYLVGKGVNKHQHPEDSIELTRDFATNQGALSELLNECKMLYGYDHMSAMYDIARLCGCPVTYLGDAKKQELKDYEPGLNGIYFPDCIPEQFFPEAFRDNYEGMVKTFSKKLDLFIESTQSE